MVPFNNIPYKRMRLTSNVNLTKCFSEKCKRIRLTTRLYGMSEGPQPKNESHYVQTCTFKKSRAVAKRHC